MGQFSWTKADVWHTKQANILEGGSFKLLIPAEFGGGYLHETCYDDYGRCVDKKSGKTYDIYELLAYFNQGMLVKDADLRHDITQDYTDTTTIKDLLVGITDELPTDDGWYKNTDKNRRIGIAIGCYDNEMLNLKYPLKLVSPSYKGTYEDCKGISYSDDEQGWKAVTWSDLENGKWFKQYLAPLLKN